MAQGGKILENKDARVHARATRNFVDSVTVHEGATGKVLAEVPLSRPIGIAARGGKLYAVHGTRADGAMRSVAKAIQAGMPQGEWQRLFAVPAGMTADATSKWIATTAST